MNDPALAPISARAPTVPAVQDSPICVLRDDVDLLSRLVDVTLRHARVVLESQASRKRVDGHRDALHFVARVEGLRRQLDHAAETLRRIEGREPVVRQNRQGAPRPEETITLSVRPS
ncbi:MAG: hypothetical protein WD423_00480 [Rhodothermales bacterium]